MPTVSIFKSSTKRRVPVRSIKRLVQLIVRRESTRPLRHLTVVLMDNAGIRAINRRFLKHNRTTDVISFDLGDESAVEGEIYIGAELAARQSRKFGVTYSNEILRLVAHGLLHVLGHDDATARQRETMLHKGELYVSQLKRR